MEASTTQRHRDDGVLSSRAAALSIVLQHPALGANCWDVCRLRQVCKDWDATVQQSSSGLLAVDVLASLQHLASFAAWLLRCHGMVGSIRITGTATDKQIAAAVLQLGLRGAAEVGAAAAAQTKRNFWQLRSFQCSNIASTGVLLALPASTLTVLELQDNSYDPGVQAAIGRLSQLRSLSLASKDVGFLATMMSVTNLTVELHGGEPRFSQLPPHLQHLHLNLYMCTADVRVINLEHLTTLSSIQLDVYKRPASVGLPTQLQAVTIYTDYHDRQQTSAIEDFGLAQLRQLRVMDLKNHGTAMEPLQLLRDHTQLRVLRFTKQDDYVGSLSPEWRLLRGLEELYLCMRVRSCLEFSEFAGALSNCGTLTKLLFELEGIPPEAPAPAPVSTWEQMAGLTALQDLQLCIVSTSDDSFPLCSGISHLGKLTQLTRLQLDLNVGLPADVADLAWILAKLTNLESLSLWLRPDDAPSWEVALLPAAGQLSRLTHLEWPMLWRTPAERGLAFLTNLRRLTSLVGFETASLEAKRSFWANLRGTNVV